MQSQSPNAPAHTASQGEVIYEGAAKHSVSIPSYLKWTLVSVAGAVVGVLLMKIDFFSKWPLYLLGLAGLPGMLGVFLQHVTTRFKITLRRVETERGVLSKRVESLELWRVLDVRYTQSLFDRLTGNGRVILESTDKSDPKLELHGLPNHRQVFEQLREAVQSARHTSRPMELVGDGQAELGHHHH